MFETLIALIGLVGVRVPEAGWVRLGGEHGLGLAWKRADQMAFFSERYGYTRHWPRHGSRLERVIGWRWHLLLPEVK